MPYTLLREPVPASELGCWEDEGFSRYVLRPAHQAAIAALVGTRAPEEVYIPQPYPFLGGSEEPESYAKGKFWVFAELVGLSHGFGSSAAA